MLALAPLFAFLALVAAQAVDPSINTPPSVVQCQPTQITFTATRTPVFISIIPGGQPSAAPLEDLGQQNSSPFTWTANIASGTSITFQIRDSTGAVAYSAPITILSSSDSSCLGASGSASASGSAAPSSASGASSSSASVASSSSAAASSSSVVASTSSVIASLSSAVSSATAPPSTSRPASTSGSTSRTSTATSASSSPSASANAARSNVQVGFAGLIGLAAAALMA